MNKQWTAAHVALLLMVAGLSQLRADTPTSIAEELSQQSAVVRELLDVNPDLPSHWSEDFWADALLRGRPIKGTPWRSHDLRRPQPERIPEEDLVCEPSNPPADAVVLFDGSGLSAWRGPLDKWSVENRVLVPGGNESSRLISADSFGSMVLHLEFATPNPPIGAWQYRGNSGVFLMGLYEIQILDSWDNPVYPDGQMGAVYGQYPPTANASLPPGQWQCLDIEFTAPNFNGDQLLSPAVVSVTHNGVLIQDRVEILGPTRFQNWRDYENHEARLPLSLQDHGDGSRVRFRNIWLTELANED